MIAALLLLGVTVRLRAPAQPALDIVNNYTEPQFSHSGLGWTACARLKVLSRSSCISIL